MMIRLITETIPDNAKNDGTYSSTTTQDIPVSEADSLLGSLGLMLISWGTLERFIERSPGNRLSVQQGTTVYTFAQVPANER